MDPLSVTASIIAVITAVSAVLKTLERIKSRSDNGSVLITVINIVTDLHATLICVQRAEAALKDIDGVIHGGLKAMIGKAQISVTRLIDFTDENLSKPSGKARLLGLSSKKRKRLNEIKELISESQKNLQLLLLSANLQQSASIREAVLIQHVHQTETSVKLEHIRDVLSIAPPSTGPRVIENSGIDTNESQSQSDESSSLQLSSQPVNTLHDSSHLRITTTFSANICDPTCRCQCHAKSRWRTPTWLSAVVGTLFYDSSYTLSATELPCNSKHCVRSQKSSRYNFTYYFPVWILRSAFVYTSWSNLNGRNSSWTLRMPREISWGHVSWVFITDNSISQFKVLLSERSITPYDVDEDGYSLLQHALASTQIEISNLLVFAGADFYFKDKDGVSAIDHLWYKALALNPTDHRYAELRSLVANEDYFDLDLGPLHKIALGLSCANLSEQIELDPSMLDETDWSGSTALFWAAERSNLDHIRTLLAYNATVHTVNIWGQSALHNAVRRGGPDCVLALLEANADPNLVDNNGYTPLHYAKKLANQGAIISALISYGADTEARTKLGEFTALHFAVRPHQSYDSTRILLEHGADINAQNYHNDTPISLALYVNDARIIQLLGSLGAQSSWETIYSDNNIVTAAAIYATADTMRVLAETEFAPVRCSLENINFLFHEHRGRMDWTHTSFQRKSYEEELDALQFLIKRKVIATEEEGEEEEEEETEHDTEGTENEETDVCEEEDVFVDAMEETGT